MVNRLINHIFGGETTLGEVRGVTQVVATAATVFGSIFGDTSMAMAGMAVYQNTLDPAGMGQWDYETH